MDKLIEEGVIVDAIICDPPYGTTACEWDTVIPFEPMWERLNKLIKPNGAIVLFGSQPFTSALISSNFKGYKYNWVWEKSKASNFIQVKNQPLKNYEDVCIFTKKGEKANYYPQMTQGKPHKCIPKEKSAAEVYKPIKNPTFRNGSPTGKRYPKAIQYFKTAESEGKRVHPTQKPIALLEYLILTYTNEGEMVLDFTMGSGSMGVACINTNRKFIGIELEEKYFDIAKQRIEEACK
jgi:site-specific DNA-methyltransferase (adenine-specific)